MKKIYSSLIAIFFTINFSIAQSLWNSSGSNIYNTNSGSVGIGTVTPGYTLHVFNGNFAVTGANNSFGTVVSNSAISIIGTPDNSGSYTGKILSGRDGTSGYDSYLSFFTETKASSNLADYSTEKLRITASGNVGIGTTSPAATLDIGGMSNTGMAINAASGIPTVSTIQQQGEIWARAYGANDVGYLLLSAGGGSDITQKMSLFLTGYNTGAGAQIGFSAGMSRLMTILPGGNVGIGSTNPDEKLTVNGTVHSTEVKVDMSVPYPDYVFKPAYRLLRLSEVKAYIDKNHHLPEAPTEDEVAKSGLNVGQSETLLLKKVEELTLYLIEQQKINNSLLNRINKLESKSSRKKLAK